MLQSRALSLCTAALLVGANAPAALGAQQPVPPTFGEVVDVRVVNVEATVVDGAGKTVRGLTAADFRLLVDGKEVPIDHFDEVVEGNAAGAPTGGEAPGAAAPTAPLPRSYLMFIDDSFAVSASRNRALAALGRELTSLAPHDQMAILAFDGRRLDALSPWTNDQRALAAALAAAATRPARGHALVAGERAMAGEVDIAAEAGMEVGLSADEARQVAEDLVKRANPEALSQLTRTAEAMAGALRGFDAPPGRKLLILLTGGWSLGVAPRLIGPFIEAANRLGYTVYPVDVAGSAPSLSNLLDPLARATGGKVADAAGGAVLANVAQDSSTYYWLGFDANFRADDKVHHIDVEVRRPGLEVRARKSYSDLSARTETAMKAEGVLLLGGASADRRLVIQTGASKPVGRKNKEVELEVTLGVPVEALAFTPSPGVGYLAEVPLAVSVLDAKGGRSDLPASRLRVAVERPPAAGAGLARFRTKVRLRRVTQRVVFSVQAADGSFLWGETEVSF